MLTSFEAGIAIAPQAAWGERRPTAMQAAVIAAARHSWLRRGAFRPSLARLLAAMRAGPIDYEFEGCRLRGDPVHSASDAGMLFNPAYNAPELDFLRRVTPPGGVFVDIGLNVGIYGLVMARHLAASGGRVLGIEPHPRALALAGFNRQASGLGNLIIAPVAVGAEAGEIVIVTDESNLGASRRGERGDVHATLLPLADVVRGAGLDRVDSLKIDVEGDEERVLLPYFRSVEAALKPRAIVMEHIHGARGGRLEAFLAEAGYRPVGRTRSNLLLDRGAA
jgi:FkbM family methyltransferase